MTSTSQRLRDPASQEYKKAQRLHLKTTRNRNPDIDLDWTPFRAAEKKYKARFPPPDLSNVLDLAALDPDRVHEVQHCSWQGSPSAVEHRKLENSCRSFNAYTTPRIPGTVLVVSMASLYINKSVCQVLSFCPRLSPTRNSESL